MPKTGSIFTAALTTGSDEIVELPGLTKLKAAIDEKLEVCTYLLCSAIFITINEVY